MARKHIVIVGSGFAGLQAVKILGKMKNVRVTLMDRTNHHLFQPLLYQVASAVLSPADIAIPVRSITKNMKNVAVLMGNVNGIDKENKILYYNQEQQASYDYLILAMGAKTGYFGNEHWKKYTIGLKSITDALEVRRKLLLSFEKAEIESTSKKKMSQYLNYVIIGGGPTGVELAGSIAELSKQIIREEFRRIDPALSTITLIEAGPRILSMFSPQLSEVAKSELEKRGVTVLINSKVSNIDNNGVHLEDRIILSKNVIWAAGVQGNPFAEKLGVELDHSSRVIVDEYCAVPNFPEIFVIGDMANFSKGLERPLPGVSPTAMQQGRYVAKLIKEELKDKPRSKPFVYVDKGSMATIGRMDAVVELGSFKLSGFLGWLAWLFVHLFYQVGFKNKISILITWIWSYISFKAGARLIQNPIDDDPQ